MSSLVVLLPLQPATASTEFDYVLTPDGRSVGAHAAAPAALLPQPTGAGAEVVAIAPASAVSWHRVELPKGTSAGSPRLRAVLEGLLEDRLLDEPETLHFALQPQPRAGAAVWVATCDRAWLRSAVQVLEAVGRPASRIVPEFTPDTAPAIHALGEPQDGLLVAVSSDGVMTLPLTAAALPLLPALPEDAPCVAEPAVAALAEQLLKQKVALQQAPQRWLAAAQSAWDLAQLDFASSGRARTLKKLAGIWAELLQARQWRPVRWAAVLLVALNLVGLNAWAWKERSALQAKREAIARTLTQTFPQVKVVVDAPIQMEKEVTALRQAAGATSGRDLEAMLGALSIAAPGRSVSALEFTGTELRVRGLAAGPEEAQTAIAALKNQGYRCSVQGDTLLITQEAAP
jgi:general secretion pathway protein L